MMIRKLIVMTAVVFSSLGLAYDDSASLNPVDGHIFGLGYSRIDFDLDFLITPCDPSMEGIEEDRNASLNPSDGSLARFNCTEFRLDVMEDQSCYLMQDQRQIQQVWIQCPGEKGFTVGVDRRQYIGWPKLKQRPGQQLGAQELQATYVAGYMKRRGFQPKVVVFTIPQYREQTRQSPAIVVAQVCAKQVRQVEIVQVGQNAQAAQAKALSQAQTLVQRSCPAY